MHCNATASRPPNPFSPGKGVFSFVCVLALLMIGSGPATAQIGGSQKISDTEVGLSDGDRFGQSATRLGDLNQDDEYVEVAVGAPYDDAGGDDRGAVYILSLDQDGGVQDERKISSNAGGFDDTLPNNAHFGRSVSRIGDVDGNGTVDLAVGAVGDGEEAVWILFLGSDNGDVTVVDQQKISETTGNFGETLPDDARFGESVTGVSYIDEDDIPDLAVGAPCGDGTSCRGAVWILFLNKNGTVASSQQISDTEGEFGGDLSDDDNFGKSMARLGNLDGKGARDMVVGAWQDNDGGSDRGALWVLFLNGDGTVAEHQKISDTQGRFAGTLTNNDNFGTSVARIPDLDGDKTMDLVVGAKNDGQSNRGAAWVLYMNFDGTVADQQKISNTEGGFDGTLETNDFFGTAVSSVGDLNEDGTPDVAAGAPGDDGGGGSNRGAFWVLTGEEALLPVELASFNALSVGDDQVELQWATASETGNAGFEVQHRTASQNSWRELGFVGSKAAGGTTSEAKSYRFRAEGLEVGTHQFRLKQVDLDGTAHHHDPVTVSLQLQEALRLHVPVPNPVQDRATVSFAVKEREKATLTLYNVLGQKVRTLYEGTPAAEEVQNARLDVSDLSSGTYLLRLEAGDKVRSRRVSVVQ